MKKTQSLLGVMVVMLSFAGVASANLIVNGEMSGTNGWGALRYNASYSCQADGTGSGYSLGRYLGVTYFGGYQDISVSQNSQYEVSWMAVSESTVEGEVIQYVKIEGLVGGSVVETIGDYTAGLTNTGAGNWLEQSFEFNSGSYDSVRVYFDSAGPIYKYYRFDNVAVVDVPEPATMALLALGGGLMALKRRKK